MLAIIPVKMSERLPGKHLLPFNGKTIIEEVYSKVSKVFETLVYSKVDIPIPHVSDQSENIMDLVYTLKNEYGPFALIGGDMIFFTIEDLGQLKNSFTGSPVVPRGMNGEIEPLFSIYAGSGSKTRNLRDALNFKDTVYIDKAKFSKYCFFNVNTSEDYKQALEILKKEI